MKDIAINKDHILYIEEYETEKYIYLEGYEEAKAEHTKKFGINRSDFSVFDYLEGEEEEIKRIIEKYVQKSISKEMTYFLDNGTEIYSKNYNNIKII